jgi:hypothetical protein
MTEQYPPPTYQPAPSAVPSTTPPRRVSALWQTVVICFVGLTVSGALVAMSLFSRNLFVPLVLAGTAIAVAVGIYAAVQGWKGSQRAAAAGLQGRAAAIALVSGAMLMVSAVAIAGGIWIVLLFFL